MKIHTIKSAVTVQIEIWTADYDRKIVALHFFEM